MVRGYKPADVAQKLGMHITYIHQLMNLLDHGETQRLRDVEMHRVPLTVAITIATGADTEIQRALSDAYQKGELRGEKLETVKRIIARRSPTASVQRRYGPIRCVCIFRPWRISWSALCAV